MESEHILRSLSFRNILSFGAEGQSLALGPLNVLIGPNSSGKSNLFEILNLLRSLPRDLTLPIRDGGGIDNWIWDGNRASQAEIESTWNFVAGQPMLRHRLGIAADGYRIRLVEELVDQPYADPVIHHLYVTSFSGRFSGRDFYDNIDHVKVDMGALAFRGDSSILAQRRDPQRYPGLAFLGDLYSEIRLYRKWAFGPETPIRNPQRADLPGEFLLEDFSNLGLILNELMSDRATRLLILESLGRLYEEAVDIRIKIVSGFVQLHIEEHEGRLISATRLSDGTLRFLCLLALLCHPNPPPLVCIEEPELGLHPDVQRTVAGLLVEASKRTQLIVTTHSDHLISALAATPDSVIVCEKIDRSTNLRRLNPEKLEKWLEEYSLGDLWLSGEIGGTRW